MLYEPMKDLNSKFLNWLARHKADLPQEDLTCYQGQRDLVREIVVKFEEKRYRDEDPMCREFVLERIQKIQELRSPPEDLIQNPLPGLVGDGMEEKGEGGMGVGEKDDDIGYPIQ